MKIVHYAIRVIDMVLYVIVISYEKNEDNMLNVTRMTVHPVGINGIVGENLQDDPDYITDKMYIDAVRFLEEDGCIDGDFIDCAEEEEDLDA
jgi:hypothetical protein